MSSSKELQKLIYDTLKANASISALISNVYDQIPADPFGATKTAYISFGPQDASEDDAECIDGQRVTVQMDIWSRAVGSTEAKTITDLARKALHRKSLTLTNNALVDSWVEVARVFRDGDGITTHGVIQCTFMIEEP